MVFKVMILILLGLRIGVLVFILYEFRFVIVIVFFVILVGWVLLLWVVIVSCLRVCVSLSRFRFCVFLMLGMMSLWGVVVVILRLM